AVAGAAVGALAVGAVAAGAAAVASPPGWTQACTPTTVSVGGTTYYQCGSAWYTRAYGGGDVAYVMSNTPPGYRPHGAPLAAHLLTPRRQLSTSPLRLGRRRGWVDAEQMEPAQARMQPAH